MFIVFILLLLLSLFVAVVVVVIRILCTFQEINKKKSRQNAEPKGQANSLKTSRERVPKRERQRERERESESMHERLYWGLCRRSRCEFCWHSVESLSASLCFPLREQNHNNLAYLAKEQKDEWLYIPKKIPNIHHDRQAATVKWHRLSCHCDADTTLDSSLDFEPVLVDVPRAQPGSIDFSPAVLLLSVLSVLCSVVQWRQCPLHGACASFTHFPVHWP